MITNLSKGKFHIPIRMFKNVSHYILNQEVHQLKKKFKEEYL